MNTIRVFAALLFLFGVAGMRGDGEREGGGHPERERGEHAEPGPRDGDRGRPESRWRGQEQPREEGERENPRRRPPGTDMLHRALRGQRNAEAILDFLRGAFRPELGELENIARERPDAAGEFARHLVAQGTELLELKRNQPELFAGAMAVRELEQHAHELAERYQRAETEDRKAVGKELMAVLDKAFALRLAQQKQRLEAMRKDIEKQEEVLREREKNQARIVQRRYEQLTGEGDKFAW
jgi:hypothetical protein